MLSYELNRLRARLDGLKEGRVLDSGLFGRARGLFERSDEPPKLANLRALDRDFDRAGIHTAADARLLKELGALKGRLPDLAPGLARRASDALSEVETAVRRAERQFTAGTLPPGALTGLEAEFVRLARAVKIATIFEGPPEQQAASFELLPHTRGVPSAPPASARVAVAEFWAKRARDNVGDLLQKRRDLDLAHELLLRAGAGRTDGDRERLRKARLEVADARTRVRSVPAVRSLHDLVRHVRHVARKDSPTAYRSLHSLYERAIEAGDAEVAKVASDAARTLLPPLQQTRGLIERAELKRSIGWREAPVEPGKEVVRPGGKAGLSDRSADMLAQLAYELEERHHDAINLAAGCARYFDVEDALSEEVVEAELKATRPVQRRVTYPTQLMTYEQTNSLSELPNFVIQHPQTLLYDLAAHQQLVRAYLEEEPPRKPKRLRQTAVRVYVLDASGSMHGPRASFRDAILIAELNAIRVKAKLNQPFDPLYFSFFNDTPTELARVDTGGEAMRQIEKLFRHSPAEGQTDITLALMSAFESIRSAQGKDPYLARATVVLVTDGEDAVDLELVRRTRKPLEGLSIALSFISLGEENPDLKSLVAEQREAGTRAFYHHMSDAEIGLAPTEFDSTFRTLLPPEVPPTVGALEGLLPHLEALEAIARGRPAPETTRTAGQFDALFMLPPQALVKPLPETTLPRLSDILEAVAEASALAPMDDRPQEAVVLLKHLLSVYGISLGDYADGLNAKDAKVNAALARVRLLCRPYA
jgi:Mg-chelatase subunit ChlD